MKQNIRILIVEDMPDHADLIRRVVEDVPGFASETVGSVAAARAALQVGTFEVILTDLHLPDSGREETVRHIREIAPRTAVIVLTCDEADLLGNDTISDGAQGYLRKDELAGSPIERVIAHAMARQRILNENLDLAEALRRKNSELEITRRDAEAAVQAKTAFLANVSHEIRTPLTGILGFIDIAMETAGVRNDVVAREALAVVQRNGEHLLMLINDILDVTKVEANAIELESIPCSIGEIVASAIECVQPQANGKGISVSYSVAPGVPDRLLLDPTRLRQILVNLIGNAVKFTPRGGVTATVASEMNGDRLSGVSIEVSDTGIGMSGAEVARVREFGVFSQANTATTRRFGGTGLGLRVCHGLATLMGGSIEIESEPERGSVFTLRLAAEGCVDVSGAVGPRCEAAVYDLTGMRVLIVDDSSDNRRLLAHYLRAAGATTEAVGDGVGAVDRVVDTDGPALDLVLMDLQMPRLDGFGALRRIRESGSGIPVFASSASAAAADQQASLRAGFNAFVAKPIVREALLAAVHGCRPRRVNPDRAA